MTFEIDPQDGEITTVELLSINYCRSPDGHWKHCVKQKADQTQN